MILRATPRAIARECLTGPLRHLVSSVAACLILVTVPPALAAQPVDLAQMLALCQDDSGETEKRLAACTLVIDDKSVEQDMRIEALMNRGTALEARGDYGAALEDYSIVISLDPASALAHYNRGNVHGRMARPEKALADYDKAIALDPKDADFYTNRGLTHADLGNYEKAIEDFDRSIHLGLVEAAIWSARGLANERLGRTADAKADYRRALELDDQDEEALGGMERLGSR
jgi:tetratricopeptide (TPR) repeat protein